MSQILETISLCKSFDGIIAADNINVTIQDGELIGVIGANGAGKTTFVNMITGYLSPSSGNIFYCGENITGLSPKIITRKGISRSFQISQIFEELTVLENMMIAQTIREKYKVSLLRKFKNQKTLYNAKDVLKKFNIHKFANTIVAQLPQGMKKLLDIGMSVIGSPKLLLLDEPTSGVAIDEKFELMDIVMNGIKSMGAAILFIEHDMEIVEKYSNRVIAFYDGRILADGVTEKVLEDKNVKKYVIGIEISNKERH